MSASAKLTELLSTRLTDLRQTARSEGPGGFNIERAGCIGCGKNLVEFELLSTSYFSILGNF
jgi:hypothetical protein